MTEWIAELSRLERAFALCAFIGFLLFVFRIALQMIGMGDTDADGIDIGDMDGAGDTDASFQFLSIHGITGFLLIFGLTGLALRIESDVSEVWSLIGAFLAGLASMVMIGQIYLLMKKLQTSGNVDLNNAVGAEGEVYLNIPADGVGQVQVSVQGGLRMYDARAEGTEDIKTGERVRVAAVVGTSTLIVQHITESPSGEDGSSKEND